MKEHLERYGIYYLIGLVILIGIAVCFVAYRPAVGTELSDDNADWGNFGAFFWGFGAMCFSLLNVIVFYHIEQRLYRNQFFKTYRNALERIIHDIKDKEALQLDFIDMIGVLGGINHVSAYKVCVKEQAARLFYECRECVKDKELANLSDVVGKLAAFQISLIIDEHPKSSTTKSDIC